MKITAALSVALLLAACSPEDAPMATEAAPAKQSIEGLPGPEGSAENQAVLREKNLQLCANWAKLASQIMDARQAGVPMRELMEAMNETGENRVTTTLVTKAYESPRFQTERHQQREMVEFENSTYAACLKDIDDR